MEKTKKSYSSNQINRLKEIAKFGETQWRESPTAAVKTFSSGKETVSFVSVGVLKEFNLITCKLYSQNQIVQDSYTLQNFIYELVDLLRILNKEDRNANNEDWETLVKQLIERPDIQTEISFPIYGVLLDSPLIELGEFKIYKKEALTNKYSNSSNPGKLKIDSEYFLALTVVAKSIEKCIEDAEKKFFAFENVANFITGGFHKTHKISLFNSWFFSQFEHLVFANNQILGGGKTLHMFTPVKIDNPYFSNKKDGYGEVWNLITSKRSDLQDKILESIEWSGKASVETDDNKALLLYMIAIEAILNYAHNSSLHVPITLSLADSVAFLLGKNKQSRIQYANYISKLYSIRSGIVHGSVRQISELDLHIAFSLCHQIIKKIVCEEPYKSFTSKKQLSEYLLKEQKYEM